MTNIVLMPNTFNWDPHSDVYARNEENMVNWEGNMIEESERITINITDLEDDEELVATMKVTEAEMCAINALSMDNEPFQSTSSRIPCEDHDVSAINPSLDIQSLSSNLEAMAIDGTMAAALGAYDAYEGDTLFTDDELDLGNEIDTHVLNSDDLDDLDMSVFDIGGIKASVPRGVKADHLSKVWKIPLADAKRTIDVTSQLQRRSEDPSLNCNYATNDRMLRYRRVHEHFFMDTLYATKKVG